MTVAEFEIVKAIAGSLTVSAVLLVVILALAKGLFVTKQSHEAVVREKDTQIAQLERLYQQSTEYAQRRGDTLHGEKEALLKQLDANARELFRFTDVIVELRDAVRELLKARA